MNIDLGAVTIVLKEEDIKRVLKHVAEAQHLGMTADVTQTYPGSSDYTIKLTKKPAPAPSLDLLQPMLNRHPFHPGKENVVFSPSQNAWVKAE